MLTDSCPRPHARNIVPIPLPEPPPLASPRECDPEVSCIIPAFNESGNITKAIEAVALELQRLGRHFEIIVVDDGSTDGCGAEAASMIDEFPVRVLRLSRNFGKENAMTAGLERAKGQAVIVIDADMQEPVSYLEVFLRQWDAGYEMVYGVRADRDDESALKRLGSHLFYQLLNRHAAVRIPAHVRDFRLMDRRVVDALLSLPERDRFMKGLYSWVGFRSLPVPVKIEPRHLGKSKFNYRRLASLALSGLTSFSDWPLRMWTGVGLAISAVAMFYAGWIALRTLLFGADVPGWATLVVAVFFLGGIQIFSIGVLGEYLGKIFVEVKGRPSHIVAEEIQGSAIGVRS
ncbi:glycosyltransferase involved in cell wall biosynthesis [Haloferula luteola]|uniref:Glycosyltransferase involved in cell wall biosynthesis n=1 Tax=Haloferula luteola TaxID=595692 RepID=A0A840V9Z3_9BACT|nr:glycosyltransferase involved in cell wall biosynthesis [Haloferula luteola]